MNPLVIIIMMHQVQVQETWKHNLAEEYLGTFLLSFAMASPRFALKSGHQGETVREGIQRIQRIRPHSFSGIASRTSVRLNFSSEDVSPE